MKIRNYMLIGLLPLCFTACQTDEIPYLRKEMVIPSKHLKNRENQRMILINQ